MRSKSVYTYSDGNVGVLRQLALLWFSAALGPRLYLQLKDRPVLDFLYIDNSGFSVHRLEDNSALLYYID